MAPSRVYFTQEHHDAASDGMFSRAFVAVRQFMCGLHGHDALLHFEQGRLSLRCTSCAFETPGWDLSAKHVERPATPKSRPELLPQRLWLAGARKV